MVAERSLGRNITSADDDVVQSNFEAHLDRGCSGDGGRNLSRQSTISRLRSKLLSQDPAVDIHLTSKQDHCVLDSHSYTAAKPLFGSPAAALEAPVSPVLDPSRGSQFPIRTQFKSKNFSQRIDDIHHAAEALGPEIAERRQLLDGFSAHNLAAMQESDLEFESNQPTCSVHPELVIPVKFKSKGTLDARAQHLKRAATRNTTHIADTRGALDAYRSPSPAGRSLGKFNDMTSNAQLRPSSATHRSRASAGFRRPLSAAGRSSNRPSSSQATTKRSYSASSLILVWPHEDLKTNGFHCPVSAWATIPPA